MIRALIGVLLLLSVSACLSVPDVRVRSDAAASLATAKGWQMHAMAAGPFTLASFHGPWQSGLDRLTIYIEGDGLAWITPSIASDDPTPVNPVGLKLALAQPAGQAAYLGRPCQYTAALSAGCDQRYWTGARYSPEVIDATNLALSQLLVQSGARKLTLVGYSGGAAVAALVAARRTDVDRLVTVAGNLDTARWTALRHLSPLTGSLNPADASAGLRQVRQWHFSGSADQTVPTAVAMAYAGRFAPGSRPTVDVIDNFQHQCCWAEHWPALLARIPFWTQP